MYVLSPFERELVVWLLVIHFIDDGMPGINDAKEVVATPLQTLLEKVQDMSQSWERLLFASGGAFIRMGIN
jgi:hypothetical protein